MPWATTILAIIKIMYPKTKGLLQIMYPKKGVAITKIMYPKKRDYNSGSGSKVGSGPGLLE